MSVADRLRALAGRRLERGSHSSIARALAEGYGAVAALAVARPLRLPEGVRVIGIGGAVLGGAGKTPLAIALARALADRGERPAFIGHAYRARPAGPRVVEPDDPVTEVGDDALSAARALAGSGAVVIVAPKRQIAFDFAASRGHRVLVADGLLQTAPRRLHAAVLTVDATAPWGAGACPPAGDLRAPVPALLAAADHVAAIVPEGAALAPDLARLGAIPVPNRVDDLADLTDRRVGLIVAVARPGRILEALDAAGVRPAEVVALGDHAAPSPRDLRRAAAARVDVWLTTARCATKLPPRLGSAPVRPLAHRLEIGALAAAVTGRTGTGE